MTLQVLARAFTGRPVPFPHTISLGASGKITHDETTGIPTVIAPDALSAVYGQGLLAGLHRAFQIDMIRRTVTGRLSEVSGSSTLEVDRWVCRLGLPEALEASYREASRDAELMNLLQRYCDGVNAAWQRFALPFEFSLLNYRPDPWTPKDCLAAIELLSWSLAGNWEEQLIRLQFLDALGEEAAWLEWETVSGESAPYAKARFSALGTAYAAFLQQYQAIRTQAGLLPRRSGSNAFVVGGNYTNTGRPILAADPHLPLTFPGWFYQCDLQATEQAPGFPGPLHVAGAAIAGFPGIVSGRNQHVAWSITTVGAITATLNLERNDGAVAEHLHSIGVKKQQAVTERVFWTERGPLLPTSLVSGGGQFSLRWVGHGGDAGGTIKALWHLAHARDEADVKQAARYWSAPVVNLVWAEDRPQGSFGWQVAGRVPLQRETTAGFLPSRGWIEAEQWQRFIPFETLPAETNPQKGYLVSANQRHVSENYPYVLSHEYIAPYRARRIDQLIQNVLEERKYTREDARTIQLDQTSLAALELRDLIMQFLAEILLTDIEQTALSLLSQWDGVMAIDSPAAAILKVTEDHLLSQVAGHLVGTTAILAGWRGLGQTPLMVATMRHWRVQEIISGLIREQRMLSVEHWTNVFHRAFSEAVVELVTLQGSVPTRWAWGKLHQLELRHPLVQQMPWAKPSAMLLLLTKLFRLSRGPFMIGGDEHTPWQTSFYPAPLHARRHPRRFWASAYQPAHRLIASGGKLSLAMPGGISGQPTHPWVDNQLIAYREGRLVLDIDLS